MSDRVILIVDDEPDSCSLVTEAVRRWGNVALVAVNEEQALLAVEELALSAIVLDLMMPERDGLDIMRELAQRGCAAPLVLVSAYGERYLRAAARFGADQGLAVAGTMQKPLDPLQVLNAFSDLRTGWSRSQGAGAAIE